MTNRTQFTGNEGDRGAAATPARHGARGARDTAAWVVIALACLFGGRASPAAAQGTLIGAVEGGDPMRMPLVEERLEVRIDRQHATTVLRQTYQNEQGEPVEGLYRLALDEGSRVTGFAYYLGESRIVGEVFEREAARGVYEDVTGLGRDPGLLEQDGEGAFTFRVAPITPGEQKRVEVTFDRFLSQRGRTVEYRVPLAGAHPSVRVALHEDRPVTAVTSPTHRLAVTRGAQDELSIDVGERTGESGELVLRYTVEEPDWAVHARVHRDPGMDPYVVVSMAVPESAGAGEPIAKDVTLVLDHSGSMSGEPLAQALRAAHDLVDRAREGDRLNVVVFDDGVESLYPSPRAVTAALRQEAHAYLDRVQDGGGTDIALALRHALGAQHADARPHLVLFLTDGQSDAPAALAAADEAGATRVYTIGLGPGVARPLLSRLATHHRGTFTFIPSAEALTARMARLYEQLAEPVMVDLEIDSIEGARPYGRYPRTLPDLFRHDEMRVAMRLLPGHDHATIRVRGRLGGQPAERTVAVDVPTSVSAPWVGGAWAAARVDELLEDIALHGETDERKDEVIELAIAYSLVTPYTSFLAIPESELTDTARESLEQMRESRRRILAANPDAVALSRSAMPPGDPVLRVHAPSDATSVTAYFPFGLVKDLRFDPTNEVWEGRFLVPNDVADGDYRVRIVIVEVHGQVRVTEVPYTIDSEAPDLEVELEASAGGVRVRVRADEQARAATVASVIDPSVRFELEPTDDGQGFEGFVALPPGLHALRVVVADEARNESDRVLDVEVPR
jgi:Ca-activated chloride channel family protein